MDATTQTRVLLVYPDMPPSFWSMKFAMEFHGRKALLPPLGLLTVAAMLPDGYDARLVDLNVRPLEDADLAWADLVMISAMMVQGASMRDVVRRCNRAGVRVVAGGPYPTSFHDELEGVDHPVLDEVEDTLPGFLRDLEAGVAKPVYRAPEKPDVTRAPIPRFDLLDLDAYHMMSLQFSRGCPFDCEFCDITKLFGRTPRTKTPEQMVDEFEALWQAGWRGGVFLVDDNFIGNQRKAMELLPAVARWQRARGYPFSLITEATVNLARNERLMDAMLEAGFEWVFLGIETPNPEALRKMKKMQNTRRRQDDYLLSAVRAIQHRGLAVSGGFIIGADGDGEESFDAQIDFITEQLLAVHDFNRYVGSELDALREGRRAGSTPRQCPEEDGGNVRCGRCRHGSRRATRRSTKTSASWPRRARCGPSGSPWKATGSARAPGKLLAPALPTLHETVAARWERPAATGPGRTTFTAGSPGARVPDGTPR